MNIGGIAFADGDQEEYDYEPGSRRFGGGFQAGFSVGGELSFDGSNLPPPPDEPPPPVPGVEGEVAVEKEKKKKKKKHRDGERGEEGEDGERRHRKKKKKHREEGEDGEKRRHRRHRREAAEGEAGVEVTTPTVDATLPEATVDLDASGALPSSETHFSYQPQYQGEVYEASQVPQVSGQIEVDGGAGAGVDYSSKGPSVSALASRFNNIAGSRPSSNSPKPDWRVGSPHLQGRFDPAVQVETTSVEDYYYKASPRKSGQVAHYDDMPSPPHNPPPSILTFRHVQDKSNFGVSMGGTAEAVEVSPADVGGPRAGLEVRGFDSSNVGGFDVSGQPSYETSGHFQAPEAQVDFQMPEKPPIGVRTHASFEPRDQPEFEGRGDAHFEMPSVPDLKVKGHMPKFGKHDKPDVDVHGQAEFEAPDPSFDMKGPSVKVKAHKPKFGKHSKHAKPEVDVQGQGDFEMPAPPALDAHGQVEFEPPKPAVKPKPPAVKPKPHKIKIGKHSKHSKPEVDIQGGGGFELPDHHIGVEAPDVNVKGYQPEFEVHGQPEIDVQGKAGFEMQGQPGFDMQGQPGLEIQGQPGFEMQGQPGFEMQGQPGFEMQGQPGFEMQGQPGFEMQGQPGFEMQGQPGFEMQGQPGFEIQGQPGVEIQGQPGVEIQGQPGFEMQGQPGFEMQGQPGFEMQGQPGFEMQGQPGFEMQGQPGFEMQGQPGFEMQGQPGFEMQGQPGFEMQGYMPGEPGDGQMQYSINDHYDVHDDRIPPSMQPTDAHSGIDIHAPSFKEPKKTAKGGGLFGLFGKKGKKHGQEPVHVSAELSGPGVEASPVNVGASGGGNFDQSPFVGSPMSTMRSGGSEVQRDVWQSNPQLYNPNADTMDPQMNAMLQAPNVSGRAGKKGKKLPSTRPIPMNKARVILLDGEEIDIPIDKKAVGRDIFDRVCDHQSIEERDYFGLTYVNRKEQTWFWLDMEKKINKQLKNGEAWFFNFQVKFYPPEPALLQEDITRYQLSLQVRQDIFTGKLPCSWVTQALLGSLLVQSEIGDFDEDEHGSGFEYLNDFQFVHTQTEQLLNKIAELHRNHKGMNPGQADLKYLETAKRLELYGYDLHPARDLEDIDIFIGVSFTGIVVYRGHLRISRFAWPKVLRISYRKNFFYLKIRSDYYEDVEAVVGFKLFNHKLAKRLWKIAVEHHSFFRLKEPRFAQKTATLPRFSSRHRFSGRTFYQYRTMSIQRPHGNPHFDRSLTKRRTASMPMLAGAGSHYGSMHSLTRQHPRDMTMGKMQSVEYLGPVPPRTPSMTRSGSVELGSRSGSVLGGSMQYLPDSAGNRVLLHGGVGVSARAGAPLVPKSKVGADSPQMQHFHTNYSPETSGARVQYQQRTNPPPSDQASLDGSEVSASRRPAGAVRLPFAASVGGGQARRAASIGSAEEDLL